MDELEIIHPEEYQDAAETGEVNDGAEEQILQETTHEPGAHIEQTQDFEQAEVVESALGEAMNRTGQEGVQIRPVGEDDGTVGRDDHPVMEDRDDLEYEPGPVQQPADWDHGPPGPSVELEKPGPAGAAEVPQGLEFKPAGEDDDPEPLPLEPPDPDPA